MLTLATIEIVHERNQPNAETVINVDIDDNGWAYIKQGDDWICFPVKQRDEMVEALKKIWL